MGTVFLAVQVSLDRKVALKTLSKELAKKEDLVKRFIREARSMARLQHPNIVQVYAADSQSGVHYAAIEFIPITINRNAPRRQPRWSMTP